MGIHVLRLLICVGLMLQVASAAVVFSDNGRVAEEEYIDKVETDSVLVTTQQKPVNKPDEKTSSTENEQIETSRSYEERSHERVNNINNEGSDDDSSSSETFEKESSEKNVSNKNTFQEKEVYSSSQSDADEIHFERRKKLQKRSVESEKSSSSNSLNRNEKSSNNNKIKHKSTQKRSLDSSEDSLNAIGKSINEANKGESEQESTTSDHSDLSTVTTESTTPSTELSEATTVLNDNNEQNSGITTPVSSMDSFTNIETTETSTVEAEQTERTIETEPPQNSSPETKTTETTDQSTTESESATAAGTKATEDSQESTTEKETQTEIESEVTLTTTAPSTTESNEDAKSKEETEEESSVSTTTNTSTEGETSTTGEEKEVTFTDAAMARVNKLSDQIRLILLDFRKTNVVTIPGQSFFPDPMPLQEVQQSFSIGRMNFMNMKIYGLSNFTLEQINTDVDKMQVYCLLKMKRLVILGNYTLRTFFNRAAGPFNVTLLDVESEGVAEVASAPEGYLEATDSDMDMFTKDMKMDFKNMGFMGSMFQSIADSVGDVIFNSIKPQILEKVNVVIRSDVNKKLKEFSVKFINKVAPVDLALSEGRKYVRDNGYDPLHVKDHTFLLGGLVYVNISEFLVEGLSRFHRVGNLSLSMDQGVIEVGVHVATEQLKGKCVWSGQTFGITKYGKTNFTVHHLQVRALVTQSLDIRKKPQLADLDLELGYVKVTMDSPLAITYMIEGVINAFPRLIRHIIVDALEQPLKEKVQELLNKINVESLVDENLPRLDSFGL